MIRSAVIASVLLSLAGPALAREPLLNPPIDCTLGESCYIQNYVDTDPSHGAADFTCGSLTYDGHKGTDFALPTLAAMQAGVDVRPAAPGTVLAIRDGMEDHLQFGPDAPDVTGRECGNGLVIDHGDGWTTQYCHMAKGSISVIKGQRVTKGTTLGQVGLSGQTQFPHVHLTVRHKGQVVDPFNPNGLIACGEDAPRGDTLWQNPIAYQAGGMISVGVWDAVPDYDAIKAGRVNADALPATSPALVVFGYAFGARAGDVMRLTLTGPTGEVVSQDMALNKTQALLFRASGKRGTSWPTGTYKAEATLLRDGTPIDSMTRDIEIVN